jgi:peptidoglycan/xylan/chitin deacetylase (PgdA/CDA1 family)
MPRHIVCLTFDFDTMSGFIARKMTSPTPLSRGEFGVRGAMRLLDLLKANNIPATWFIPGFTLETYPGICENVIVGGHEIGHHGWNHHPPASLSRDQEEDELAQANEVIKRMWGKKAHGYRSPSWDLSPHTIELLIAHGFIYDTSMMGDDYSPYWCRQGDVATLDRPYEFGKRTDLIEMPISWSLDDHPHFEYMRTDAVVLPGLRPAREVLTNWFDEFIYMQKTVEHGILTLTMHPYVIGRGYRMLALEDLVAKLAKEGAVFMTMEAAALEAKESGLIEQSHCR